MSQSIFFGEPRCARQYRRLLATVGVLLAGLLLLILPKSASAQLTSFTATEGLYEDRVVLNWTGDIPVGATIMIERSSVLSGINDGVIAVRARSETEFIDRTVVRGDAYNYNITYENDGDDLEAVGYSKIFAPTDVTASASTRDDGVLITWRDNSDVETGFTITRSGVAIAMVSANAGMYLDETATAGASTVYCVSATDQNAAFSDEECAVGTRAFVAPPTDVIASDGQYPDFVRVTWNDQSEVEDEFRIYQNDFAGNEVLVGTVPGDATTSAPGMPEVFDDVSAVTGTTIGFCVSAVVGGVESIQVCDVGVRGVLASPTDVTSTYDDFDDRISATWVDDAGVADGYKIGRMLLGVETFLASVGREVRSFSDPTASQEVEYEYCVTAFSTVDVDSTFSNRVCSAPGRRTTVLAPTNVAATDANFEDRVGLTWADGSTTAMLFNVYRDGVLVDNVPTATPFFVDAEGPANVAADYCVTAVSVTNGAFSTEEVEQMIEDAKRFGGNARSEAPGEAVAARAFEAFKEEVASRAGNMQSIVETTPVCDSGSRELLAPTQLSATYDEFENHVQLSWTDNSRAEAGYIIRRLGAPSSVLEFDGVTSEVTAHATTVPTLTDYTIEAWIRHDGGVGPTATNKKFVTMFSNLAYAVNLSVASQSGEWGRVHVNDIYWATPLSDFSSNRDDLDDNEWHHVLLVRDWTASTLSLYIDGVLDKTVSYTPTPAAVLEPRFVFFGRFDPGTYYNGFLSGVSVFDQPKSSPQVRERFESGDAAPADGLVYDWPLNDGAGSTAIDRGPNAQNGTISGTAWVVPEGTLSNTLSVVDTVSAGRQTFGDFGGVPGIEYPYYVTAYDERGLGGESAADTDLGYRKLEAPTAVQATDGTSETEVLVTWIDNSRVETGYEILRDGFVIGSVAANATSYAAPGSPVGSVYTFAVRATDNLGVSAEESDDGNTAILPPGDMNASDTYPDKVVIVWEDKSDIESLYWVSRDGVNLSSLAANTTTFTDNAPPGAGPYTYCVESASATDMRASSCDEGGLLVPAGAPSATAVGVSEYIRADNSAAGEQFRFGTTIALDGDKAIVVGGLTNVRSTPFVRSQGGDWQRLPLLQSFNGGYASQVDISGDVAIVSWSNPSQVAFLQFVDGAWASKTSFSVSGQVKIDGSRAVVGELSYAGGAGNNQGRLRIYDKPAGGSWVESFLLPTNPAAGDFFGASIALSGDYIAAGSFNGTVRLFQFDGASWNQVQELTAPDCGTCSTVAMDGPYLVVSDNTDASINAHVFELDTTNQWTRVASLTGSNNTYAGSHVDISGNRILVGVPGPNFGLSSGRSWIFERAETGWTEVAALTPASSDGTPLSQTYDFFGSSVAISPDFAFIGSAGFDPNGNGAVFIQPLVSAPSNVAVSDGTFDDRIQLSWTDSVANEELFNVYRQDGDDVLLVGTTPADGEFFDDFSALPGGTYEYCVAAANSEIAASSPALGASTRTCDTGWRPANGTISGQISALVLPSNVLASTEAAASLTNTALRPVGAAESESAPGSASVAGFTSGAGAAGAGSASASTFAAAAADNAVDVCIAPSPNKALQFDGVGGYVSVPYVPTTTAMTACAWIKTTSAGEGLSIVNWGNSAGGTFAFWHLFNGLLYYGEVGNPGFQQTWTNVVVNTGEWVHVCVVKDGTTATLFVDGQQAGFSTGYNFAVTPDLLTIGASRQGDQTASYFKGAIDEVQLWDAALTPTAISALLDEKPNGSAPGLEAYWPLDQASGRVVADVSSNAAHGALVEGVYWVDGPVIGECVRSDQNGNYTFSGLRYGEEATFTVKPQEPGRDFTPSQKDISLSIESPIENQVDFTDNTQFGVAGVVQFQGTTCPARDIQIQVDGENRVTTESDGTFSISLFPSSSPTDLYRIRPQQTSQDASDVTRFSPTHQDLFVGEDLLGINFVSLKKRTLRGYYGGSCPAAGNLGSATLRVFTEDGCFDETYPISGNFELELPPQKYLVEVAGLVNAPAGLEADMVRFFDDLGAQEVDLSATADTIDFIFRPDLIVDIAGFPAPPASCPAGLVADGRTLPNVPVIGAGQTIDLSISVREDYGNGNFCTVTDGNVEIFDGIADLDGTPLTIGLDSTDGQVDYTTIAESPNITSGALINGVDRSFQKSLTVVANVVGKSPASATEWAIVEGVQPRTAEFISATTDPFPLILLRDPPGGNSYAYIEKGTTNCQTLTDMHIVGGGAGFEINLAVGFVNNLSTGFGVIIGTDLGAGLALRTNLEAGRSDGSGRGLEVCATTTERWSTSTDPSWAGEDLYMGVALNLVFARADNVTVDEGVCRIDVEESLAGGLDPDKAFETTYVYGGTHIEKSLIPALEDLIDLAGDPTLSGDPDGDGVEDMVSLTGALSNWQAHLTNEEALAREALEDRANVKNISFSSGADYEYGTTFDSTNTWLETRRIYIENQSAIGTIIVAGALQSELLVKFNVSSEWTRDSTSSTTDSRAMGYVFSDGDTGDFYSVDVGEDPRYGTPVFGIVSGRSSSPWERGPGAVREDGTRCGGDGDPCTQRRDWPEITVNPPVLRDVDPDGTGSFEVTLTNRSENNERRQYALAVPGELNSRNLGMKVTGGPLGGTRRETFTLEGGESRTINVDVSRVSPTYAYENVGLMLYPELDYAIWQSDPRTEFATSDTAFISVYFDAPCSDVSILRPESPWYYNSASGPLELKLDGFSSNVGGADSLVAVGVQYRRSGTAGWLLADSVHVGTIGQDATSWLDGLWTPPQDGQYELRAFSECVATEPGDNPPPVYSDVAEGTVDNKPPVVFGTPQPADQILTLGRDIAITFDEPVACESFITNGNGTNTTLSYASGPNQGTQIAGLQRVCDGRTVILAPPPTFDWAAAEGLVLEASIDDVTDLAGNELAGNATTWLFSVRRSAFVWSPANVDIAVTRGTEAAVTAQLVNGRARDAEFDIPMTFKLGSAAGDTVIVTPSLTSGTVVPGGTATVSFLIPDTLPLGEYAATVEATRIESGFAQEIVPFYVNANVVCAPPPSWTVNPAAFQYSMTLTALLNLSGTNSVDGNDQVVALVGNEVRGAANIDDGRVTMVIHSNALAGETIRFEVWDDSACTLYDETSKAFVFENNTTQGTIADPAVIMAPFVVNPGAINLAAGWTWMSLNKTPVDASVAAVLADVVASPGDVVKYGNNFSIYDEQFGWVGTLPTIDPGPGYQIYLQQSNGFVPGGTAVDLASNPVAVLSGWNWIGYLPQAAQPVNDALQSLTTASDGDVIKSQFGFAQYDTGSWFGSLANMEPGLGYQLNVTNAGTVTFSEPPTNMSAPATSVFAGVGGGTHPTLAPQSVLGGDEGDGGGGGGSGSGLNRGAAAVEKLVDAVSEIVANELLKSEDEDDEFNPRNFETSMTVTATVTIDGDVVLGSNAYVWVVDEAGKQRGFGRLSAVKGLEQYRLFLMVYGHQKDESELVVRAYNPLNNEVVEAAGDLRYDSGAQVGTIRNPLPLNLSAAWKTQAAEEVVDLPVEFGLRANFPNPFRKATTIHYELPEATQVSITVFDLLGREVLRLVDGDQPAGRYDVSLDARRLASGVYVYRMKAGDFVETHKMTIVK